MQVMVYPAVTVKQSRKPRSTTVLELNCISERTYDQRFFSLVKQVLSVLLRIIKPITLNMNSL